MQVNTENYEFLRSFPTPISITIASRLLSYFSNSIADDDYSRKKKKKKESNAITTLNYLRLTEFQTYNTLDTFAKRVRSKVSRLRNFLLEEQHQVDLVSTLHILKNIHSIAAACTQFQLAAILSLNCYRRYRSMKGINDSIQIIRFMSIIKYAERLCERHLC